VLRLPDFTYRRPQNLREAAAILAGEGSRATVVAGGTDLWPKMKRRQMEPRVVIGLRHLNELRGLTGSPETGMTLGPNLTLREVERIPVLQSRYPAVAEAARLDARPLDNTDLDFSWRRSMVEVWVRRALEEAARRLQRQNGDAI
jgi:4-hydroxybenzoyl-CoA reductase subunit beta